MSDDARQRAAQEALQRQQRVMEETRQRRAAQEAANRERARQQTQAGGKGK
jgi:hypothetical protein